MRHEITSQFCFSKYGQIIFLLATLMISSLSFGATEKILHSFNAWPHGYQPSGGLIADTAGNLYRGCRLRRNLRVWRRLQVDSWFEWLYANSDL